MFVSFLVSIYVARYLGPEQYGVLNYAMSFVWLFSSVATLGLDGIVIRNLVEEPEKRDSLLGTSFVLKLAGAFALLGLVSWAVRLLTADSYERMMIMIIAGGMLFQSFNVVEFYFQSQVQARFSSIAQIVSVLAAALVKVVLVFSGAPLVFFAWVVVLEYAVLGIALLGMYCRAGLKPVRWSFDGSLAGRLLRDSWPLILSGFSIAVYMRIDQVMLKDMVNSEGVGLYAVAVKLSEIWTFIPVAITASLFPAIVSAKQRDVCLYDRRMQGVYDLMVLIALCIALPMSLISDPLVMILFGPEYIEAGSVLKIYVWSSIPSFLGIASGKHLIAENRTKMSFIRALGGALINVGCNILMIPKYGITGAAWATLISYSVSQLLLLSHGDTRKIFKMMIFAVFLFWTRLRGTFRLVVQNGVSLRGDMKSDV